MRADYRVVLDACVLIPMPLADTLLRMAEAPRLYLPKWSQTIMDEVTRNLIVKWGMAPEKARRREEELRRHFPEVWAEGFEPIIDAMTNDPGDRHVLAAAVRSHSELIVTYNRRHFPAAALQPWEIDVQGPSKFMRGLYDLDAGLVVGKLHEQAAKIQVPPASSPAQPRQQCSGFRRLLLRGTRHRPCQRDSRRIFVSTK
ncbi:MAG: PIN domain-containing protein [Bryobacteraceae bacterium]|nr:PIN domain-containing protein [Bryobacteraceae bacterium]